MANGTFEFSSLSPLQESPKRAVVAAQLTSIPEPKPEGDFNDAPTPINEEVCAIG